MAEITCRACRSAPVACESLCIACLRDKLAADKERHRIDEQRQRQVRRHEARKPGAGWDRLLKSVAVLLVLAPLVAPLGAGQLIMEGRLDCAKWFEGRADRIGAHIVQGHLLGILNGIALGSNLEFWQARGGVSREQVYLWMDEHCRTNPLSSVARGALILFDTQTDGMRQAHR